MSVKLKADGDDWDLIAGDEVVGRLCVSEGALYTRLSLRHRDAVASAMVSSRVDWRSVAAALLSQFGMILR